MYLPQFLDYFADKHSLTGSECSALHLRFEHGKSNKQIAEELGIDITAVNHRMGGIYKKLRIEGDTRGKDVQLRKCLNKELKAYCNDEQFIHNTPLDLQQIHDEIQQLKAIVNDFSDQLRYIRYPSCPYRSNDYITANGLSAIIKIFLERINNDGQEKDVMFIINNLGDIFRNIAINSESECERNTLNKISEFLKTVLSEEPQLSVLESALSNKPEFNIDAELKDTV